MDTNSQIISDLRNKIGFHQSVDFLSERKGVPVVIKGQINKVNQESIVFKVEPPDSICMDWDEYALLLHDSFISGIQGRILNFDLAGGQVEVSEFAYSDRGFGDRSMVRVEPDEPLQAEMILGEASLPGQVVDLSLNGFGVVMQPVPGLAPAKGQALTLKLTLAGQNVEIPGTVLGVFPKEATTRLAISFSQDAPGHAAVTRYIARRRAEIRQEIQTAYQHALEQNA